MVTFNYARLHDAKGMHIKDVYFQSEQETFKYKDNAYNIRLKDVTYTEQKGLIFKKRFYYYNINHTEPLILTAPIHSIIEPKLYNVMLETSQAQKLNDLSKKGLLSLLTPKVIIIGLVAIGVIIYLASGGSIA